MCRLECYKRRKVKLKPKETKKLKKLSKFETLWKITQNRFYRVSVVVQMHCFINFPTQSLD